MTVKVKQGIVLIIPLFSQHYLPIEFVWSLIMTNIIRTYLSDFYSTFIGHILQPAVLGQNM